VLQIRQAANGIIGCDALNPTTTYRQLFAYLEEQGFRDVARSTLGRIFEHQSLGILFAFSMMDQATEDSVVREADALSVEFQLQQRGLLDGRLAIVRSVDEVEME